MSNTNLLRNNLDDPDDIDGIVGFVLDNLGTAPPPASFFKNLAEKSVPTPTVNSLQARLENEKDSHKKQIAQIYDFQAAERDKLLKAHRLCMDEGDYTPNRTVGDRPKVLVVGEKPIMPLPKQTWATTSSIHQQTYTFDTTLDTFQAAFLASQEPLYAQLEALKSTKKHDEERRNATLPTSLVEFDAITSKSHQIAIARFLDTGRIQALPPELQTSSAISALGAAYDSDASFKIRVKGLLASIQSSDPRKRVQA